MGYNHAVYCPASIWGLRISCIDRMFLAHVYYCETKTDRKACIDTNKFFAEELDVSVATISKVIKRLEEWEYITVSVKRTEQPMWAKTDNPVSTRYIILNKKRFT